MLRSRWHWDGSDWGLSCFKDREKLDRSVLLGTNDLDMMSEVLVEAESGQDIFSRLKLIV